MKITLYKYRKILIGTAVLVLLFIIAISIFSFSNSKPFISPLATTTGNEVLAETDSTQVSAPLSFSDRPQFGILLLGYGGMGHDGGFLTDAIQLIIVDLDKKTISLISIPRDLWVKLPSGNEVKINTTIVSTANKSDKNLISSGAPSLKKLVSSIANLPADYFVGIDFVGLQRVIGIELSGIEVKVEEKLDDPWYPITGEEVNICGKTPQEVTELSAKFSGFELERQFPCRYEHLLFNVGISKMQGGEALKFMRSRHGSAEGDISRGKRQQAVLKGIQKKLVSLETLKNIPKYYEAFTKHVTTDINLELAKKLGAVLDKSGDFKIITINLSTTNVLTTGKSANGQAIILPKSGANDWTGVQNFIQDQLKSVE